MAIDAYSLCPGGSGKKIKFCSPECLPHLQKLAKMMEGGQLKAALMAVEEAEKALPDKACILNFKIKILESLENWDEAERTQQRFAETHPENPIGLAFASMLSESTDEATDLFEKAWERSSEVCHHEVLDAAEILGERLCAEGRFPAGIAILRLCLQMPGDEDAELAERVRRVTRMTPFMLRGPYVSDPRPDGAEWEARFEEARKLLGRFQWSKAIPAFEELANDFPKEPSVWLALAYARMLRGNSDGAIEAFSTYADLDVEFEMAVEVETMARLLSDDPLGDMVEYKELHYPVLDVERLNEALLAEPRALSHPNPSEARDDSDEIPPKAAFGLLDRAIPKEDDELTAATLPLTVAITRLFGRQTDREAYLDVRVVDPLRFSKIEGFLKGLETLGEPVEVESDQPLPRVSLTRKALFPIDALSQQLPPLRQAELLDEIRHAEFEDTWCALPLGILDGKTPDGAAGDPAYRRRLAAAVLIVESWQDEMKTEYDFNRLRMRLKIPTLGPVEAEGGELTRLRPSRWHRLRTEKLTDDQLFSVYEQARAIGAVRAMKTAGGAILNRPSLAKDDRLGLVLHDLTVAYSPFDESLKYCDQGRRWSDARDESPVVWDIYEYEIHVDRRDMEGARAPFQRIMDNREHPLAAEFLDRWMAQMEALQRSMQMREGVPPEAVPEPEPEPSKLWTPDSDTGGGSKQKIWTPDMD